MGSGSGRAIRYSSGVTEGRKPCSDEPTAETLRGTGLDEEDEDTAVALAGVGDLEVGDVHVERAGQRGDLGEHPGAVGHGDPDLAEVADPREARREVGACAARLLEHRQQPVTVGVRHDAAHLGERREQAVEHVDDGGAVLGADVRPDAGVAGRDAGHVAEAAGRQPQQGAVLRRQRSSASRISEAAVRCGHVGDDRHQRVVVVRRQRDHVGPQTGDRPTAAGRRRVSSVVAGRGQHPHGAREEVGSAPSIPSCSEPAIGWPPTKRGSSTASTIDALTLPTSVTIPGPARQRGARRVRDGPHRRGQEGDLGRRIVADRVERAQLERPRRRRSSSRSAPADVPALARAAPARWSRRSARCRPRPRVAVTTHAGQVVAEVDGPFEVHVVELVAAALGREVHQHPDAPRRAARRCPAHGRR